MRLLLVDAHPLFLEGLRSLALSHGITVVGTAKDGLEALVKTRKLYHMKQILSKLHLSSRKQAVGYLKRMQEFLKTGDMIGAYQ